MEYTVEFYSRKRPFKRRLWYWRIRHENGNIVAIGGEGYYNRLDRNEAFHRLIIKIREGGLKTTDSDK